MHKSIPTPVHSIPRNYYVHSWMIELSRRENSRENNNFRNKDSLPSLVYISICFAISCVSIEENEKYLESFKILEIKF